MFFDWVAKEGLSIPVILAFSYEGSQEDLVIHAAAEMGSLLCDGLGDGIWIRSSHEPEWITSLSFSLLQSARMRMSKTVFQK